jgi:putative spermidine/putrescine transport system substrate-binding protein
MKKIRRLNQRLFNRLKLSALKYWVYIFLIGLTTLFGCSERKQNIDFYATGTLTIESNWSTVKRDLGFEVTFADNGNDVGPIISNMINGSASYDFDVSGIQGGAERELANAGKILPWDTTLLKNWRKTWSWIKEIPHCYVDGKLYGIPIVANADAIIYLPEKIGYKVTSYEVIFNPKFKGKVAMEDSWINSVIFTAIYLKENNLMDINDPGDLTEIELKNVMEFLIQKKKEGQFKTFWNGWEHGLNLIKSGEVYAMTGWEPIQIAAKKAGINCEYAVPREGYEGWTNDLLLNSGTLNEKTYEKAHLFADWLASGYYGCLMASERGYIVPNDLTLEYAKNNQQFDEQEIKKKIQHVKEKFSNKKIYWQNTRPKNYKLYEEWWSKLRNS